MKPRTAALRGEVVESRVRRPRAGLRAANASGGSGSRWRISSWPAASSLRR